MEQSHSLTQDEVDAPSITSFKYFLQRIYLVNYLVWPHQRED